MKKLSVTKQVLNILNTQGGKKPKQLIAITKAKPASVYNALNQLRGKKMIAKEDDGVYITQTQTSVGSPSATRPRPRMATEPVKTAYTKNLEKENLQLTEWTQMWKRKYEVLERDYTQAKVMYLNSQAVVAYLEEKVAQLIKG
jgi:DNA-binding IclR family transcriptional regulator